MKNFDKRALLTFLVAMLCLSATEAFASFTFQVSPRRGGQSIHFDSTREGDLLKNEEVTLSVDTDEAVQYRITQTLFQPLTNEYGQTIPQDAFFVFSPSNPIGNLRTKLESPVSMGQFPIYTSGSAGESDEFVLVYNVRLPEGQQGGVYRAQITFTAEPVTATAGINPSITTLDVRVEVDAQFRLDVVNSRGTRTLDLGKITKERSSGTEVLNFDIQSSPGARFRLAGEMSTSLTSQQGQSLAEGALMVAAGSPANSGTLQVPAAAIPLASSLTPIYISENGGSDRFQLVFAVTPEASQKAGIYSGALTLRLDSQSPFVPSQVINIPVQFEIESIFSLETKIDEGFSLNFGSFRSGKEKEERRVILTVRSNLGEPYQVSQIVPRKMMNEQGAALEDDNFQFSASTTETGVSLAQAAAPVQTGEHLIFTSDKSGTPENIILNYTLSIPPDSKAGNYTSEIKYSITTL